MTEHYYSIPIELMEVLNRISDSINDVKERMARLEAQDQTASIRDIWNEFEKERNERIKLQVDIASIKTKLAPIAMAFSMAGAVVIDIIIRSIH